MSALDLDIELLQRFERGLDARHPERSRIPARVLGYGEISTVFEIQAEGLQGLAFKRLPLFDTWDQVERYRVVHEEYVRLLSEEVGLHLPPHSHAIVLRRAGQPVFYIVQRQFPTGSIGNQALHHLSQQDTCHLLWRVLQEMSKVWAFNRGQTRLQLAIDAQVSNWAIAGSDLETLCLDDAQLWYLDTSTPLLQLNGVEQLDVELFMRSAPSFLAWILRLVFLKDVVNRYYDPHLLTVDLVANLYKEQRPDLIPDAVNLVSDFCAGHAGSELAPITADEVRAYYREDALIWTLYLSMRQVDRVLRTRLLRREYPYILPPRIKR